jgi:single-strand DNA-binding protein
LTIVASIYGRAARDGELRTSQSGKPWCRVSVACEAGVDRETGDSRTQWLTVVAFGRQAEELAKIEKGQAISAIGRVEINRWRTQDGQEREGLQLIADSVVTARSARPAGRKPKGNGSQSDFSGSRRAQAPSEASFGDDLSF